MVTGLFRSTYAGGPYGPPAGVPPVHTGAAYMGRIGIRAGQLWGRGLSGPGYKAPVPWHGRGSHVNR